eukprot:gb/GEZN01006263.1/.p1 GENE.gb/GEZN01006263.1/~~gb/GEZN01006263.1/.p1  ORF type:complete len:483 (-),score=44.41 gb/GEZN01006263.1/:66-1514(-)
MRPDDSYDEDLDSVSVASSHGSMDMVGDENELDLSSDDGDMSDDFADAFPNLNSGPEELEKFGPPKIQNIFTALIFAVVSVGILWVEFLDLEEHRTQTKETEILVLCSLLASLLGLATLFAWMVVARIFLFLSHTLAVVCTALLGLLLVLLSNGSPTLGVFCFLAAISLSVWTLCNRVKLDFATVMLDMVVELVIQNPTLLMVAGILLFIQTIWLCLFSLACVQMLTVGGLAGAFYTHALFAYLWTTYVLKFLVHSSIAGAVSHWYFRVNAADRPMDIALDCFKRSGTYYLGTICLGSFLVMPVELVAGPLYLLAGLNCRLSPCSPLCKRIRGCTERIYQSCNRYAFTHVITYGKHFTVGSRDAWDNLSARGLDSIMAGNVSAILLFSAIWGGSLMGAISAIWAHHWGLENWVPMTVVSFGVGFASVALATEVVDAAITAVCACFAIAPSNLAETHPIIFHRFIRIAEFSVRENTQQQNVVV